jgi:hypothetical protein
VHVLRRPATRDITLLDNPTEKGASEACGALIKQKHRGLRPQFLRTENFCCKQETGMPSATPICRAVVSDA